MQLRLVVCLAVVSCTCRPGQLGQVEEAQLRASPMHLVLPAAYVGYPTSGVVEVANVGGTPASVEVSAAEPFSVETGQLELVTGESRSLVVRFAPTAAGLFDGVLRIGALEVTLAAEGLEVPVCSVPANVCEETRFEAEAGQCVTTLKEEGSSCQTRCIASGSCLAGACRGQLADCDDGNACTVDACGEAEGCVHSSRVCPAPAGRCQIARCDPLTGCGAEEAPDGTLCGPDDCKASEVDVCIAGKCVRRQRPDQGRCVNTWVPVNTSARSRHAMAYDLTRQRVVLFGGGSSGHFGDTWEWDGTTWVQRTPAMSPPARAGHAMAYDTARQRVVLFGGWNGVQSLADTWEWDGTTWVQRAPTTSPPAVSNHVMAYDVARQRVVVFSRDFGAVPIGTWEWDGTTWVQRMPTTSPPALINPALAYDMVRQRVVLFGHEVGGLADTWEWDGTTWVERTPAMSPPVRTNHAMTYDAVRQRVVLFGGYNGFQALSDTWEWDGTTWAERTPAASPPQRYEHALAYDVARQRVVLFGGVSSSFRSDTWEWDGATWVQRAPGTSPPALSCCGLGYDVARQRVVLFGGAGTTFGIPRSDTWEWDGATWVQRTPATSPPARYFHALAYDVARQRVVVFGGAGASFGGTRFDTWEWDGTTWAERTPAASPPQRYEHALAYDTTRQRVVLFGGNGAQPLSDTWEWDGTTWVQRTPTTSPPARYLHALAYDMARQRVVLFGGIGTQPLSDTWEWDGTTWVQRTPAMPPPARFGHALAYDTVRQRVVLTGGVNSVVLADTWEWDGTTWVDLAPTRSPAVAYHSLAYDAARQRLVLFDGSNSADTWLYLP